jgi:DNA-binding CsgD family transcriptional regulator
MDLTVLLQAVDALSKARNGDLFVLLDPGVADVLMRIFPSQTASLVDWDIAGHNYTVIELSPIEQTPDLLGHGSVPQSQPTEMFSGLSAAGEAQKALVMPLPAPPSTDRRLVFVPMPGHPFGDAERSAAVLLQPHIADALRVQGRTSASRLLTGRQRELLSLVAAGHDNIAIACRLDLSPATVRKHLANAFARLEVSSRTAAVAKICADVTWREVAVGARLH